MLDLVVVSVVLEVTPVLYGAGGGTEELEEWTPELYGAGGGTEELDEWTPLL